MSELDTKYVDEALNYKTKMKKPIWIKWGIMAACLCLIICVVTIPRLLNGSNPPISGDLAPMVYVNNKLYQYTDSQLDFTDKESQFTEIGGLEPLSKRGIVTTQIIRQRQAAIIPHFIHIGFFIFVL